jgi:pimeloyl-ACP methyl ester carboxylesterase
VGGYRRILVPVDGGDLTVGVWGHGVPMALAVHGITSSHLAWAVVADRLGGGALAAVDLRGRGGSAELPGPYGMARHAADCVAMLDALGVSNTVVVGHSMGGFVALVLADRHPDRVSRLVLVDGGPPLRPPPGGSPDEQVATALGPAARRLSMRFADRVAYHEFWRAHPAFRSWSPAIESYLDYDLTGAEPELRSRVSAEAMRQDFTDLHFGDAPARAWQALRHPAVFLRAERGMFDEPVPLYPQPDPIAARIPLHTIPDANHYTILLDDPGATEVAAAVREAGAI